MPTPEETFSNLDADRNGRLDANEIDSNRFVARMLRNSDTSRGMSRDEFLGEMQRIRESYSRNRPGGFGGPPGGPDSDRRRDRDNGDGQRDGNPGEDNNNSNGQEGDPNNGNSTPDGTQPNSPTTNTPKPRPRVTIDLQQDLLPADSDRDGQLGLYEWRRFAGRSLKEFNELDRNHDGFVTPREVALARPEPTPTPAAGQPATPPGTQPAPSANSPEGNAVATPGSGAPDSSGTPSPPSNDAAARDAERFFRLLDRNRDGQIAPDEWRDGNTRNLFTTGGVDLSQPMSADDFSQHYVRLSATR